MINIDDKELQQKCEELKQQLIECKKQIEELSKENSQLKDSNEHLSFTIKNELEPRIKQEKASYDAWVSYDRAAEIEYGFCSELDRLIEQVQENPEMFDWGNDNGDLQERIVAMILSEQGDK